MKTLTSTLALVTVLGLAQVSSAQTVTTPAPHAARMVAVNGLPDLVATEAGEVFALAEQGSTGQNLPQLMAPSVAATDPTSLGSPVGGLLSFSPDVVQCVLNAQGNNCKPMGMMVVGVVEEQRVSLQAVQIITIQVQGVPTEFEVVNALSFEMIPRVGSFETGVFDIHIKIDNNTDIVEFDLSPDDPVFALDQPLVGLELNARLFDDAKVVLSMLGMTSVTQVDYDSLGILLAAGVDGGNSTIRGALLTVDIQNYGDLPTNYLVTVTDLPDHIVPVNAKVMFLAQQSAGQLQFELRALAPLMGGETATVRLKSLTGRLYDEVSITLPTPTL